MLLLLLANLTLILKVELKLMWVMWKKMQLKQPKKFLMTRRKANDSQERVNAENNKKIGMDRLRKMQKRKANDGETDDRKKKRFNGSDTWNFLKEN